MPREFSRTDRVADAIQRELAPLIREQIRDPRIGMVSINAVQVSKDLSNAKVFVTFVDNPKGVEPQERVVILSKAAGFLRSEIAREIRMRSVPQLRFVFDETVYKALEMSDLIDRAIKLDKTKQNKDSDKHSDDNE